MQEEANDSPASDITSADIDSAPDTIARSQNDPVVPAKAWMAAFVRVTDENEALTEELEKTRKRVKTTEILDSLIKPYASKAFWFMCGYSGIVGAILLLHGFTGIAFELPENVLEFLVGSTAVTVIGLVGMVLTGVFVGARNNGKPT